MTNGQLKKQLAKYADDLPVVIDVNIEQCNSDRNVLPVIEVRCDNVEKNEDWFFIQA